MVVTWRAAALMGLGVIPVLFLPANGTVLVWAAVVVLACLADVLLAASPRRVAVQRRVPASVRLRAEVTSELVVRNVSGRRLRAVVRDAWGPSSGAGPGRGSGDRVRPAAGGPGRHHVDLPDGEAARLPTTLVPTRRGDRAAGGVTVRSLGPLGLAGRQVTLPVPGRLRVLPEFASRKHLPSRLARLREMDGRAAVQIRGEGTEFDSLREYVVGDDVRSIDWRATARRREVVVRTWRPERDRRVLVVLDTGRTSAARWARPAPRARRGWTPASRPPCCSRRWRGTRATAWSSWRSTGPCAPAWRAPPGPGSCPPSPSRWPRWSPCCSRRTGPAWSRRSGPG
nr:hypothetical protein GCM10025730_41390 [Promicromonospora thailandica]